MKAFDIVCKHLTERGYTSTLNATDNQSIKTIKDYLKKRMVLAICGNYKPLNKCGRENV
jgi:hypothetical protein